MKLLSRSLFKKLRGLWVTGRIAVALLKLPPPAREDLMREILAAQGCSRKIHDASREALRKGRHEASTDDDGPATGNLFANGVWKLIFALFARWGTVLARAVRSRIAHALDAFEYFRDYQHQKAKARVYRKLSRSVAKQGEIKAENIMLQATRQETDRLRKLDEDQATALAAAAAAGAAPGVGTHAATQARLMDSAREDQRRIRVDAEIQADSRRAAAIQRAVNVAMRGNDMEHASGKSLLNASRSFVRMFGGG